MMGRKNGNATVVVRVACGRRTCVHCRPKVVSAKVEPLPEALFAREIERADWSTLDRNLRRRRARGDLGDFARIPLDHDRLLIVSDSPIGEPINREQVRELMSDAHPAHGQITASKAWQPDRSKPDKEETGIESWEICSSSAEWIVRRARRIGIPPEIDAKQERFDFGLTSDEEHAELRKIAGAEPLADYWHRTLSRRPHGDTLARMAMAVAA